MLCPICHGSGWIVTTIHGLEWWLCPCCGGAGVRVQYGPPVFRPDKVKSEK